MIFKCSACQRYYCRQISAEELGGYSGRVPPLPIPNREVKTARADGTAVKCGRVSRRQPLYLKSSYMDVCEDFFVDNYDHHMFEGDIQLVDMIYLKKKLMK